MVEVFKTNVHQPLQAYLILDSLQVSLPHCRINFDLEDCDRILRVEGREVAIGKVLNIVQSFNCECQLLD